MKDSKPTKKRGATLTMRDMLSIFAVVLVLVITFLFIILNYNDGTNNMAIEARYDDFSKDWHLQTEDRDEVVDFPVNLTAPPNSTITISKELPKVSQYYAVVCRNYHLKMDAYVGDELIYHFPEDDKLFSEAVITDDWNMVHLTEEMTGKTLRIVYTTGNYGYEGYIKPAYLGEDNSIVQYLRAETAIPYAMSVSVIAIGGILILLGILYQKYNTDRSQIIAGLMLVTIGLWITNRSKMPLYYLGSNTKYLLAFWSLSLEAVLILLYVLDKFKHKNQRNTLIVMLIFGIFLTGLNVFALATGYPLDQIVKFVYGAILLSSLYMVYMLYTISYGKDSKCIEGKQLVANKLEFIAANIMTFGVVIGIIFDFIINNNRMWTDIGTLSKIVLNIYALTQVAIHVYRSYNGVIEREEIRKQLHDSQLELMMGQIQPHFIFNTLSSIRTLIKVDPDLAYSMVYDFSNYLRANVDNMTNLGGIQFASELEHIKSYVNIEKVRFGHRLEVEYDAQVTDFLVPPLSIQPIIENAIKHGVCKKPEGGTVWLRSYTEGNFNVVEIEDDGVGFDPKILEALNNNQDIENQKEQNLTGNGSEQHKSSGMKNIMLRLKEMSNADMIIESTPGVGTKTRVLFPIVGETHHS